MKYAYGLATVLLAIVTVVSGCAGDKRAARPLAAQKPVVRQTASREELLLRIEDQMARFANLKAKVNIKLTKQDILVPLGMTDNVRRLKGEDYSKKFLEAEVNGLLLLSRPTAGVLKVRFSGEVIGPDAGFVLLGVDEDYWVMVPNPEAADSENKDAPKNVVYTGIENRRLVRPEGYPAIRPQDVAELILYDEAYAARDGKLICYMETWPDYYVLNFLEQGWREHITSKIWIDRGHLSVALHQIFDGSGQVVAEARFRTFAGFAGRRSDLKVTVPLEMDLLWPKDEMKLQMSLSNVSVNDVDLPSSAFEVNFGSAEIVQVPPGARPGSDLIVSPGDVN
jgi:hypothetical protein